MTDFSSNRKHDVVAAVAIAVGAQVNSVVEHLEAIESSLDWTERNTFANVVNEQLLSHVENSFAFQVVNRLDAIESSISTLDR